MFSYARKAKRVDVRRLKGDLWLKINTEFQADTANTAAGSAAGSAVDVDKDEENAEVRDIAHAVCTYLVVVNGEPHSRVVYCR